MSAEIIDFATRKPTQPPLPWPRFVVELKRRERMPNGGRRCFWRPPPCEDGGQYLLGRAMAIEYMSDGTQPVPLQWIVRDMPREIGPIEVAFLSFIGQAAEGFFKSAVRGEP